MLVNYCKYIKYTTNESDTTSWPNFRLFSFSRKTIYISIKIISWQFPWKLINSLSLPWTCFGKSSINWSSFAVLPANFLNGHLGQQFLFDRTEKKKMKGREREKDERSVPKNSHPLCAHPRLPSARLILARKYEASVCYLNAFDSTRFLLDDLWIAALLLFPRSSWLNRQICIVIARSNRHRNVEETRGTLIRRY